MEAINLTIKIDKDEFVRFRKFLEQYIEIVDYKVLPNTKKMYEQDEGYRRVRDTVMKFRKVEDKYINDNNYKYK